MKKILLVICDNPDYNITKDNLMEMRSIDEYRNFNIIHTPEHFKKEKDIIKWFYEYTHNHKSLSNDIITTYNLNVFIVFVLAAMFKELNERDKIILNELILDKYNFSFDENIELDIKFLNLGKIDENFKSDNQDFYKAINEKVYGKYKIFSFNEEKKLKESIKFLETDSDENLFNILNCIYNYYSS